MSAVSLCCLPHHDIITAGRSCVIITADLTLLILPDWLASAQVLILRCWSHVIAF